MRHASVVALLLFPAVLLAQPTTVRSARISLPTYPYYDPDPVPSLARNPLIYPYTVFDGFSVSSHDSDWNVIRLENRYVSLDVAPGLGGKILGAVERSSGKRFIYTNDAVKFRRIALRGPWTSGGIEFNFGIVGHTPTTAAAVDHAVRRGKDGSAVVYVGAMDLPSRTRWTVAIGLRPDDAAIETRAVWHNPTPFFRSQYSWSTAAVEARNDLRYFYPGFAMVPHGEDIANESWPVDRQGRDVSYYRNNNFEGSKSNFIFGAYEPFFGTYAEDEQMGLGHWARYDDMPGRKVWIWSLARDGGIWEGLLTDRRGQYSEPQAGRLFSQVDHDLLWPGSSSAWTERWFPVKAVGGMKAASPSAVLNVEWTDGGPTLRVLALKPLSGPIVVAAGGREVRREKVSLKPMESWTKTIAWSFPPESLRVDVAGQLHYVADPWTTRLSRPIEYRSVPETTAAGQFLKADRLEKERRLPDALAAYRACIEKDPYHVAALARSSLILSWMRRTSEAVSAAWRALQLSRYDAVANYAFGVASRQDGQEIDAMEAFGWAARSPEFAATAYAQLAELHLRRGQVPDAVAYARRAVESGPTEIRAQHVLALALRLRGEHAEAREILLNMLEADPLDHQASYELALLGGRAPSPRRVAAQITNEFPEQSVIEAALWYAAIGRTGDALTVLQSGHVGVMSRFWQAYLQRSSDSTSSRRLLAQALEAPIEFVVPFREEEIPLFRWASEVQPDAWKAKYYLGLLYWAKGRTSEAFDAMRALKPEDAPSFYLTRAALRRSVAPKGEVTDLAMALEQGPGSWRSWHAMNAFLAAPAHDVPFDSALSVARAAVERFPDHTVIRMDLATALFAAGAYGDCTNLLDSTIVLPYEGSWEAHDLLRRARLMAAVEWFERREWQAAVEQARRSTEYPEHLGSGEPWESDRRAAHYIEAACRIRLGDSASAHTLIEAITSYTGRHGSSWGSDHLLGWAAPRLSRRDRPTEIPGWIPPAIAEWLKTGIPLDVENRRSLSPQLRTQYEILSRVRP